MISRTGLPPTLVLVAAGAWSSGARAQELRHDQALDATVTLGGAAVFVGTEVVLRTRDPLPCRWCDRDEAGGDTLNGLDRSVREHLRWSRPWVADRISDVTGFVVTPLFAGGADDAAAAHDRRSSGTGTDLLLIAEAGVLAADVNELAKLLALRERPAIHALSSDERRARTPDVDDDLSFYSGHTTEAVSLAVASGTIASLRGYRLAPMVWGVGLAPALVTGYLRIGADRHYFTDVAVGAVAGALIGFFVPFAFHNREAAAAGAPPASTNADVARPLMFSWSAGW